MTDESNDINCAHQIDEIVNSTSEQKLSDQLTNCESVGSPEFPAYTVAPKISSEEELISKLEISGDNVYNQLFELNGTKIMRYVPLTDKSFQ